MLYNMGMDAKNNYPRTLIAAVRYFADLDVAHEFFTSMRWPDGAVCCPRCGDTNVIYLAKYRRWECKSKHAKRQFSVKVGTVMEDSAIPLDKWAVAFWLEANAKNSISSYEVHRALGITQKSAWFMQHRIRLALQDGDYFKQLTGDVEVDETFIGGKSRNMHASKRKRVITSRGPNDKTAVMGLLDRNTREVRTVVIPNTKRRTLHPLVREHVLVGSNVFTDAHPAYVGLAPDFLHQVVDHAECYVRGNVHTNGLENFWSLFKRCIKGTHVSVEPFHLFRYLDAETFRFNNRKMTDGERFLLAMRGFNGKRLTYAALTGGTEFLPASDENGAESGELPN
jgi:transposase-like protein